jgi:hypothetical protein
MSWVMKLITNYTKDIFNHLKNYVGHCNYIGKIIKYMFWHYEHFLLINKCNFIEINVTNYQVNYEL